MNVIVKIKSILDEHYPEVIYEINGEDELTINPKNENGFQIFVQSGTTESTINFNSWHWHCDNTEDGHSELMLYFGMGLSKTGRLKTFLRNGNEYKWTFESKNQIDNQWHSAGTVGLVNLKIWTKKEIKYYQNDHIQLKENINQSIDKNFDLAITRIADRVDRNLTEQFYVLQSKIIEDCSCNDCRYFVDELIFKPIQIFEALKEMGVDLRKNLDSEPTGVWIVRQESGEFIFCEQAFHVSGNFHGLETEVFEQIRAGYKTIVETHLNSDNSLTIYVTIEKRESV